MPKVKVVSKESGAVGIVRVCTNNLGKPCRRPSRRKHPRPGEGRAFRETRLQAQARHCQEAAEAHGEILIGSKTLCCNCGIPLGVARQLRQEFPNATLFVAESTRVLSPGKLKHLRELEAILGRVEYRLCGVLPKDALEAFIEDMRAATGSGEQYYLLKEIMRRLGAMNAVGWHGPLRAQMSGVFELMPMEGLL